MNALESVLVVSRWLHLLSMAILVGGTVFMRYALMPAASQLPQAEHDALRERLLARWKVFVHALIVLLILTGIVNIVGRFKLDPTLGKFVLYHVLLTCKILLALVVFFVASALVGRSKGLEPLRQKRAFWMTFNITAAALIILLSGILRLMPAL